MDTQFLSLVTTSLSMRVKRRGSKKLVIQLRKIELQVNWQSPEL